MAKEVIMPALGMAQETGTLLNWHKQEGDTVKKGDLLMTVATDKTDVDIEASATGILRGIMLQEGEEAPVGAVIAWLLADGEALPAPAEKETGSTATQSSASPMAPAPTSSPPSSSQTVLLSPIAATPLAARVAAEHNVDLTEVPASGDRIQKEDVLAYLTAQNQEPSTATTNGRILASPKARRLAQEQGIDLATLNGTGPEGAILAADVEQPPTKKAVVDQAATDQLPSSQSTNQQSIIAMSRPWLVMAKRLQESWQRVPHFYLERDVNARQLVAWRNQLKAHSTLSITYTDLLVKLVAVSLQRHPRLNAAWHDGEIVANSAINIGLAVAVEDGLLVPVVRDADQLRLSTIAKQRADLVKRAGDSKLQPADLADGTFTISNLGMFGVERFNAIVNPPQAAILAVGALTERVVPVDGKPSVQPMMTLTLSCDHRVVDGARAAQFLQTLVGYIEEPLRLLD